MQHAGLRCSDCDTLVAIVWFAGWGREESSFIRCARCQTEADRPTKTHGGTIKAACALEKVQARESTP